MSKCKPASDLLVTLCERATTKGAPLLALLFSFQLHAQSAGAPAMSDPNRVVVIVDDAGDVGLRISDAQMAHETVIAALRKRLGNDAVAYEGEKKNAATMKKMLGPAAETTIQDARLTWFDAAEKAAPWRVRVRFGAKKGQQFIRLTCRKASDKADHVVDERVGAGKNFVAARDDLAAHIGEFCLALPDPKGASSIPIEGANSAKPNEPPGMHKKPKQTKTWTPPPRRD